MVAFLQHIAPHHVNHAILNGWTLPVLNLLARLVIRALGREGENSQSATFARQLQVSNVSIPARIFTERRREIDRMQKRRRSAKAKRKRS